MDRTIKLNFLETRTFAASGTIKIKSGDLRSLMQLSFQLTTIINLLESWNILKGRLEAKGNELVTKCYQLKMQTTDGKKSLLEIANAEQLLSRIQDTFSFICFVQSCLPHSKSM